jgi:hypothetical protein
MMYPTTSNAQLKHNHVHDVVAAISSSLSIINLWPFGFDDEPYLLHVSRNGIVILNNWNYFKWQLSDYLGDVSNLYPDNTP